MNLAQYLFLASLTALMVAWFVGRALNIIAGWPIPRCFNVGLSVFAALMVLFYYRR